MSQLANKVKREIKDAMLIGELMDEYRDNKDASRLVVDWIKL